MDETLAISKFRFEVFIFANRLLSLGLCGFTPSVGTAFEPAFGICRYAGRKDRILDIDPEDLSALVSLRGAQPGQKEIVVHPKIQNLPVGVTANVMDVTLRLIPLVDNSKKSKKKKA